MLRALRGWGNARVRRGPSHVIGLTRLRKKAHSRFGAQSLLTRWKKERDTLTVDRTATIQAVTALEASIRRRADTDTRFLNWWIYILLVSWITFGIASIYFFVKRISRIDKYSVRKLEYYTALTDFTDRFGQASQQQGKADPAVRDMRAMLERAAGYGLKPIGALKSLLLTIVTFGIWGIIAWYQINRAWVDRQQIETEFDQLVSSAWTLLGITRYPITFEPAPGKDRNFWLYLGLTIITFGIWGLVWDYKVHTDPESIFPRIHQVEDSVLQLVRAA